MSSDDEKPHPPVPPSDSVRLAEHEKTVGSSTVEREPQGTECPACGGPTVYVERETGRVILDMWDATDWDSEEYELAKERHEIERYQECERCGWRVYV